MKVLLLCGGEGTRLHPLTKKIPKPLIKIKNKTIIDHIIEHLSKYGLKEFLVCSGYKSIMIERHFDNYKSIMFIPPYPDLYYKEKYMNSFMLDFRFINYIF